ncbi:MAG: YceI family protein [Pseudomonadota bacterium]|nr:YceI family protein [Pseudomonadota bacterium]
MTSHNLLIVVLCGLSSLVNATPNAADWKQQTGSTLGFTGQQQGEPFQGHFRKFASTIRFDPAVLAKARFDVSIDISSADSANSERDETMLGAEFFDSKKFPKARFTTRAFRQIAPGKFEADATLTIRDKSVALKFPFTWSGDAKSAVLKAKVTLDRLAFGLGTGDWEDESSIGYKVEVNVYLKLAP